MPKKTLLSGYLYILLFGMFFAQNISGQSSPPAEKILTGTKTVDSGGYFGGSGNGSVPSYSLVPQQGGITFSEKLSNVDYLAFGVGGMDSGSAGFSVNGISGTVRKAFLYFNYADVRTNPTFPTILLTVNGSFAITPSLIAASSSNCWGQAPGTGRSYTMMADVTTPVRVTGNGLYIMSGFPAFFSTTFMSTNGASLLIIYDDGNNGNNRDIYIYHGNDALFAEEFPGETDGWNSTLSNIAWNGTGTPSIQLHVADGQNYHPNDDGGLFFNGTQIVASATQLWDGSSVPSGGSSRAPNGSLWDIKSFPLGASYFISGTNNLTVTSNPVGDCYSLAVAVVSVPASTPTAASVSVAGKVTFKNGSTLSRAGVSITDTQGNIKKALTNPFGYYRFDAVTVSQTYIVQVSAKGATFSPQVITPTENVEELNFVAQIQ